mgnify:CR=1 FL=1
MRHAAGQQDALASRRLVHDRHRTADDTPYGGGAGMVLKPEPFFEMQDELRREPPIVLLSARGKAFTHADAVRYSVGTQLTLLCGHYKGVDVALRALAQVPEARLRLAGEGPLRGEWEALARTLGAGLTQFSKESRRVEEVLTVAAQEQLARLDQRLRALEVMASIAPLLGLLGTVLGMIDIFSSFMGSGMTTNAAVLAGGPVPERRPSAGGTADEMAGRPRGHLGNRDALVFAPEPLHVAQAGLHPQDLQRTGVPLWGYFAQISDTHLPTHAFSSGGVINTADTTGMADFDAVIDDLNLIHPGQLLCIP